LIPHHIFSDLLFIHEKAVLPPGRRKRKRRFHSKNKKIKN